MSTKTTFKRIALVAVAALGFGMLSVVPSSAAAPTITASASVTSGTYKALQLVPSTSDSIYTITSSGVGTIAVPVISGAATAGYKATSGISATGATYFHSSVASDVPGSGTNTVFSAADTLNMSAYSAVAGTQTITITGNVSGAITSTITWGAAPTISTAYSTSAIAAAADVQLASPNAPATDAASVLTYTTALNFSKIFAAGENPVATVGFDFRSGPSTAFLGQAWTAVIASGPGLLDHAATGTTTPAGSDVGVLSAGSYLRSVGLSAVTMAADSYASFGIYADGTAGTSVINLYAGTVLWKTFTVTFYGSPAKILVEKQRFSIAKSGTSVATPLGLATGATGQAAVVLKVVDSLGFVVPGQTVVGTSSDPLVLAGSTVAEDVALGDFGAGYYNADVTPTVLAASAASATITYSIGSGTTKISSDPVKFTLGGSIAKTTVTTDASSYTPGAPVVLTVTAVDASGNPTYDNQLALASLTANKAFVSSGSVLANLAPTAKLVGGKYATSATAPTLFAPATEGDWTLVAVGRDADDTVISVTGTVTGSSAAAVDAAAEATDAANAATDAANAAAEAADAATAAAQDASDAVAALSAKVATLISALKAQLTSLTNLVIKIQKKVKA